jgi:hypothetical protein
MCVVESVAGLCALIRANPPTLVNDELLEVPPLQQAQHKVASLSRGKRERSGGTRTRVKRLAATCTAPKTAIAVAK